jgi:hypothetical protein
MLLSCDGAAALNAIQPRGLSGTLAMQARLDVLSSLPLPQDAPADALRPFTLPARHELAQLVNAMPEVGPYSSV